MQKGSNTVKKPVVTLKKHDDGTYHVTLKSGDSDAENTYITSMKLGAESMVENIGKMIQDGCDYHTIINVVAIVLKRALSNG